MKINQENFVKELRRGNEKALLYVIDEYGGLLRSVIRRHLFALPDRQEECMNDVLLGIWNYSRDFDESRNTFQNWAAGVARYKSIDYLRKYKRELEQLSWEEVVISAEDEKLSAAVEQELSEEVGRMLECLNETDKKLFLDIYGENMDIEQVSRDTGMKKEVIYNRLSRGKKKIRQLFSRNGKEKSAYETQHL